MKYKLPITTACIAALACCVPTAAFAAPKTAASPSPSAHASPAAKASTSPAAKTETTKTARAIPFHGTISAVDQSARTFTIAGKEKSRVFKVSNQTVITKAGAAATMADIAANEQVTGSYWKAADGSLEAKTVKLGPKAETEKAADKSKKKESKADASPSPKP